MNRYKGGISHCSGNPKLRPLVTKLLCKVCLVLQWVKVKQGFSKGHSCYGQETVGDVKVLLYCPGA